ncbi:MAG: hypothetical protein HUU26_08045 [Gemmatimonadaceae bacterium]|nr:hypothetical protein [Phycisphaerales bacterium]NUQ12261.1 hypothetical protein [Gemmatimonadaceae bacterium]
MTTQKDFKRLVRGRMRKTGESYTAARARLMSAARGAPRAAATPSTIEPNPSANGEATAPTAAAANFEKLAGMSDARLKEKTGCTWDKWVWALDRVGASAWPHKEIAQYVHEKYKVPGWWSQTVTVGYERIKGLREIGQRRSGVWEASKSRMLAAPLSTTFKAFKQPKLRAAWLSGVKPVERSAVPNRSIRFTWEDGSSVQVYFVSKGRSKTQVAVQHTKLPDRADADRLKAFWTERLGALAERVEKAS